MVAQPKAVGNVWGSREQCTAARVCYRGESFSKLREKKKLEMRKNEFREIKLHEKKCYLTVINMSFHLLK